MLGPGANVERETVEFWQEQGSGGRIALVLAATDEIKLVRVAVSNDRITDDPSEHARLVAWTVPAWLVTGSANAMMSARENMYKMCFEGEGGIRYL